MRPIFLWSRSISPSQWRSGKHWRCSYDAGQLTLRQSSGSWCPSSSWSRGWKEKFYFLCINLSMLVHRRSFSAGAWLSLSLQIKQRKLRVTMLGDSQRWLLRLKPHNFYTSLCLLSSLLTDGTKINELSPKAAGVTILGGRPGESKRRRLITL